MANMIYQPGDRVAPIGYMHNASQLDMLRSAETYVVERQMPYNPDLYQLSDGRIYSGSELHLVERAGADLEIEHVTLNDGTIATHLKC